MRTIQMRVARLVGQQHREIGDVITLDDSQARRLVDAGVATFQIEPLMETATTSIHKETATLKRKRKSDV